MGTDPMNDAVDDALGDLFGVLLDEIATTPRLLLGIDRRRRHAVVRVAGRATPPAAFHELLVSVFDEIRPDLVASASRTVGAHAAEDVAQTAFIRMFARRPDLTTPEEVRRYLWVTVRNLTTDELRRLVTVRQRTDPGDPQRSIDGLCGQAGIRFDDRVSLRRSLISALASLSPREREAIVLRFYAGYSVAATAAAMGVSEGSVKSYAHQGLKRARRQLQPGDQSDV